MNIQPTNDKVDRIFERYNQPGSPGCALAVIKDGKIVYQQGYGLANLEHNTPMMASTVLSWMIPITTTSGIRRRPASIPCPDTRRPAVSTTVATTSVAIQPVFPIATG